jgi:uncharacterized protein with HEPN domain
MATDPRPCLNDILHAIEGAREATVGVVDFETYARRRPVRRAVEREIEIISEASRRIPEELKAGEPTIPWQDIAGIGNILRHDYQIVSDPIVWNVLVAHLSPLEAAIRRMLAGLDAPRTE